MKDIDFDKIYQDVVSGFVGRPEAATNSHKYGYEIYIVDIEDEDIGMWAKAQDMEEVSNGN